MAVTALRERRFLYFAHEILLQVHGNREFLQTVARLRQLSGLRILYVRNQLEWPIEYSVLPLRYGFNFARVSMHQVRAILDLVWFAMPNSVPELCYQIPVPGFCLGD